MAIAIGCGIIGTMGTGTIGWTGAVTELVDGSGIGFWNDGGELRGELRGVE